MMRRISGKNRQRRVGHRRSDVEGTTVRPALAWYFVCFVCNAKWFGARQSGVCPRCGAETTTTERLIPPWLR